MKNISTLGLKLSIVLTVQYVFLTFAFATAMDGNEFLSLHDKKENSVLNAYMAGISDSLELSHPEIGKCLGNVRMSQLTDTVVIYLKKNPQVRHYPLAYVAPMAFKAQFGCKP